jgi:ligand-binding sensor domain-containing protein
MADGLSHSLVHSIKQDQYGFIWLGTQNGLNIYDGTRFRHYLHNSSNDNISFSNSIIDLILDGDTVWVAAENALLLMDVKTKHYRNLNIGKKDIRTILLDKNNETLWIGTNTGLLEYSISSGNIREYNTANSNISHDIIRALYKGDDGTLWIGTYDKLNILAPKSSIFEVIDVNPSSSSSLDNQLILSI